MPFGELSAVYDTVGEFPKQRTYAFYPAEFKELTRLSLTSPTVSTRRRLTDIYTLPQLGLA
jgi:hypothetical protein